MCLAGERLLAPGCYEELVEFATCPSCGRITTNMKILPCNDYCCLPCLQQQLSQQRSRCSDMNCPSCSHVFPVPPQGLEHLPSNSYITAIVPAKEDVGHPVPFRDRHQIAFCSGCRTKKMANLKYCKECRQSLCEQCSEVHRNLRLTQTHHVVGQRQSLLVDCDSLMCSHHPTKTLQVFCSDCASLCCVMCLREVHHDHNWCDVDEVSQRFRQQLDGDVETVRTAASRCEQEFQRLEDAEKMLTEHVLAVQSQTNSQRDYLINAIDRETSELHEELSRVQNIDTQRLRQNKEQIRKQKQFLQCFDKFCRNVIETGTVHEVIHVYNSIHQTDEELPLQHVSSDAEISRVRFTPVELHDFLPQHAQHLIGSVSDGHASDENTTQPATWNQLQSQLQQALEQLDQSQQQVNDNQHFITSLQEQLTEKTELLEKAGKELEEKQSLVVKLDQQMSDMASDIKEKENVVKSLTEEVQQRDSVLDEYMKHVKGLSHKLLETEQRLHEYESKLEKTAFDLDESERSAAEYRGAVDQLNVRVQQLEESLSHSMNVEDQMATELEDAKQQISEQSVIIEHVPPTAGEFGMFCRKIALLLSAMLLLLTPTTVAGLSKAFSGVCVCICVNILCLIAARKTKTKLARGIFNHKSSPIN